MSDSVLVIGGGIAGIQASLDLAEAGAQVVLVAGQELPHPGLFDLHRSAQNV